MDYFSFPADFVWGVATASFQVEGAHREDGKGPSTWDVFTRRPGKIKNGDTADRACDHYHLYKEDVALMKYLGVQAYRFSISWPRIQPEGEGAVNPKGIAFYDRLIDELLDAEIIPFVTLFHWDLPQALEDRYGGWRSKKTAQLFGEYSAVIAKHFSDRVKHYITVNEISCYTLLAYKKELKEVFAPGKAESDAIANQTVHNAMLGHGLSCRAIRANSPKNTEIGIAHNPRFVVPLYDNHEHIAAAQRAFEALNGQILFPLLTGQYGDSFLAEAGENAPHFTGEEMKIIAEPLDFVGYNYYNGALVRPAANSAGFEIAEFPKAYPRTHIGWPIIPRGMYHVLMHHQHFFGNIPVYITENGCSAADETTPDGEVFDYDRLEYLREHLQMLCCAMKDGVKVKGYFAWSLLDNFEWAHGYSERFGLVRVDYSTMKRTVKLSGKYYQEVIRHNRVL
jgi:beta-glucosidase